MLTTYDEESRHYHINFIESRHHLLEYPIVDDLVREKKLLGQGHERTEVKVFVWMFEDHMQCIKTIKRMQIQIVVQKNLKFPFLNELIKEVISSLAKALVGLLLCLS